MQPGIISVLTADTPIQDVLVVAGIDVLVIVALVASVALLSSALEYVFKTVVDGATGSQKTSYLLEGYLTYPGVVYHELSHALFGFLSGARIGKISLRRIDEPDGTTTLGSVQLYVSTHPLMGAVQLTFSGIAPSVMGMLALVLMCLFAFPNCTTWWMWVLWIYAFVCVLLHSEMSRQDLKEAGRGLPIIMVAMFLLFMVFPIDVLGIMQGIFGI